MLGVCKNGGGLGGPRSLAAAARLGGLPHAPGLIAPPSPPPDDGGALDPHEAWWIWQESTRSPLVADPARTASLDTDSVRTTSPTELWWRTDEDQATGNGSGEEELPGGGSDMLWWYGGSMRRGPLVVDLGLPVGSGMGSSAGSWIFFCFFYRFTEAGVF